jgi:hypothetical protein
MISIIRPLPIGNALRIFVEPPAGAKYWRVLRKASDTFDGGPDDDYALKVYEGDEKSFVDAASLPNEQMAFYKPFYRIGSAWVPGETGYGTPASTFEDHSTDVIAILRSRLEAGMRVECERGNFATELGYIQVFTAPPSLGNVELPVVTVELDHAGPGDRAIGEDIIGDEFDDDGWMDSEGWLENVTATIVAWSLNSDERIELRKALRRILLANLPVLNDAGVQQVSFSFTDMNAVGGEFDAPMYQVICNFSCIAPARVSGRVGSIEDVEVTVRD